MDKGAESNHNTQSADHSDHSVLSVQPFIGLDQPFTNMQSPMAETLYLAFTKA